MISINYKECVKIDIDSNYNEFDNIVNTFSFWFILLMS